MSKYDDLIDMSKVEPPKLIEEKGYDAELEAINAEYVKRYPDFEDETEYEPVRAHLGVDAWIANEMRVRINEAGKAGLLASATGTDLNVRGWGRRVERKVIDAEAEIHEEDDDYRERIHMAPESWSVAGPQGGYEFWAESVEAVKDAHAISPSPAVVDLYVIGHDISVPATNELLSEVDQAVSGEKRRPLADRVTIHSAAVFNYTRSAKLRVQAGPSHNAILTNAQQALAAYQKKRAYIGKGLPKSALNAVLMVEGVEEVILTPDQSVEVTQTQIAHCEGFDIEIEVINV